MWHGSRRDFLGTTFVSAVSATAAFTPATSLLGQKQPTVHQSTDISVLNPRMRVPLSFIIDDSTCLVNMGHFCMPQFAEAWPDRDAYKRPWKSWPREIPDAFVREFGEWCLEHGVKGKYSVVPYPACVGWLDRELPGWSRRELQASLRLVRELMLPNWDIHPEMISHTRVLDLKTARPMAEISAATMENSYPQSKKSVDHLAAYLAYALRILKNCDLPCEGITTPGGFGGMVKNELSLAVQESVRDVYGAPLPHYFKYIANGEESTEPKMEHVRGLESDDPRVTVNVLACTGDWFGGWDGIETPEGHRYSNAEATSGRMVEVIQRGEPAIMLCHWPGMYCNGSKQGFHAFQQVITALHNRFQDQATWMKLSEIAQYWAAKKLTTISRDGNNVDLRAPFACPGFTLQMPAAENRVPQLQFGTTKQPLTEISDSRRLRPGTWVRHEAKIVACFDLPKGRSKIEGTS